MHIKLISKQEAQEMLRYKETIMVDVREPEEFDLYRVDGENIVNIPLKSITERLNYLAGFSKIICICRTNRRSIEAANIMTKYGIDEIYVVDEGINGWLFGFKQNKL